MPIIKIHLETPEYHALEQFATDLKLEPEAVALCALKRLMLAPHDPHLNAEIAQTWAWHRDYLPLWTTSDGALHVCPERIRAHSEVTPPH